jgi:hypothetical protein
MQQPFPGVPKALLDELEKIFPDELPKEPIGAESTAFLIGRQAVIRKLRAEYNRQQNADPKQTTINK